MLTPNTININSNVIIIAFPAVLLTIFVFFLDPKLLMFQQWIIGFISSFPFLYRGEVVFRLTKSDLYTGIEIGRLTGQYGIKGKESKL